MKQIKKMRKFECSECGSNELGYQKYVMCITPVIIKDGGQFEYGQSEFDEDDYIWAENGFICMNCKGLVEYCGCNVETEKDLIDYLTTDSKLLEQQEKDYESYVDAQVSTQEQRKKEQECYDQEIADMPVDLE